MTDLKTVIEESHDKRIDKRNTNLMQTIIKNRCLIQSKLIYAVASLLYKGNVRINIAMRCRDEIAKDWGHAWVTHNGSPVMEFSRRLINKPRTKIAESGKFIYWIYE